MSKVSRLTDELAQALTEAAADALAKAGYPISDDSRAWQAIYAAVRDQMELT